MLLRSCDMSRQKAWSGLNFSHIGFYWVLLCPCITGDSAGACWVRGLDSCRYDEALKNVLVSPSLMLLSSLIKLYVQKAETIISHFQLPQNSVHVLNKDDFDIGAAANHSWYDFRQRYSGFGEGKIHASLALVLKRTRLIVIVVPWSGNASKQSYSKQGDLEIFILQLFNIYVELITTSYAIQPHVRI